MRRSPQAGRPRWRSRLVRLHQIRGSRSPSSGTAPEPGLDWQGGLKRLRMNGGV